MKPVKEIVLQYARVADERDALWEQVKALREACLMAVNTLAVAFKKTETKL